MVSFDIISKKAESLLENNKDRYKKHFEKSVIVNDKEYNLFCLYDNEKNTTLFNWKETGNENSNFFIDYENGIIIYKLELITDIY